MIIVTIIISITAIECRISVGKYKKGNLLIEVALSFYIALAGRALLFAGAKKVTKNALII